MAAEIAADERAEETVGESDERHDQRNVNAFDKCEHTGVASQFIAELGKGLQTFLGLGHKVGIALEGAEAHGVVDVGDGNAVSAQLLTEEHIFIAIIAETLIKGVGEHQVATDEEIGCVEIAIGILLATLCSMILLSSFLITIAEIVFEGIWIAAYTDTTINDLC